ncbi:MAG TPA: pitrilysin family protein [Thermoanaerobaculia bacterium]|jgi:zinc protease|nr:pitrilysin family protein [Thermoanaerobaculia bacterium]
MQCTRHLLLAIAGGIVATLAFADAPTGSLALPVEELVLDNGMRVLLAPRPGPGLVAAAWAVRRGSGDEPAGKSGVAHLVEHLLHGGSTRVTASDYARLYTEAGAVGIDARTDRDVTAYFLQLPPERLELWFWLESDRLLHPSFGDVGRELQVIAEERRQRLESTPLGPLEEELQRLFWGAHPYAATAGGAASDLAALTRADAETFFGEHYGAGEITAVLVGDFEPAAAREMAGRYFGRLPRVRSNANTAAGAPSTIASAAASASATASGAAAASAAVASLPSPPAAGTGAIDRACACAPQARIAYPTVAATDPDRPALDVLAGILGGRTGRLQRALVDRGLAFAANAQHESGRRGGALILELEARGSASPQQLVEGWDAERARLLAAPPTADEMERVRNQVTTGAWRGMREPLDFALRLLVADAQDPRGVPDGGWRSLEGWPRAVLAVEPADVQRVARRYLVPERRLVARITRSQR